MQTMNTEDITKVLETIQPDIDKIQGLVKVQLFARRDEALQRYHVMPKQYFLLSLLPVVPQWQNCVNWP
jgi:hypothetical protein